ncbi:hypothetical protein Glove_724g1 [Diversispora epigaea]|uniref:Peroxisomal membrane protein PMP47B n=1 Tax=Diversispora epigaea TaxID=1348612 RepID=A0A397G3K7_9GLOM|nr:hypothetical protein Glove_724g1 [Diversispora epigaea]
MSDNVAHAISGAGGGIISMVLTYPLITISSRLQVQKDNKGANAYKGGRDAIVKILKNEGVGGLYSGLSSAIFGISITNGVYYYFYELTKKFFEKSNKRGGGGGGMSVVQSMIAGAIAGSATVIVTNPIWVVNTRMTTRKESLDEEDKSSDNKNNSSGSGSSSSRKKKKNLGTIETISKIIKEDGIKSFWQGVIPALILVINPIIQYTTFEQIKAKIEKSGIRLGNLHYFLLGAISKLIATGSTYPYIVIKSRMQLRQSTNARYRSVYDGLQKIIRDEGFGGLYKGFISKVIQSVLTAAFLFMYKEALFKYSVAFLSLFSSSPSSSSLLRTTQKK